MRLIVDLEGFLFYNMKKCNHCKIEKEFTEFYKNKNEKDGVDKRCKFCSKIYSKKYREKFKEIPLYKNCKICLIYKDKDSFHKRSTSKDGLYDICKNCRKPITKKYNIENKDKIKQSNDKWRNKNPNYKNKPNINPLIKYSKRLEKCIKIHNDFYSYIKTDFTLLNINKEKSIITCPIHGDFELSLQLHIKGRGCQKCSIEKVKKLNSDNPTGWSKSNWLKHGNKSKNFDSFKVYIIKCWNDNEEFFKIGRTYKTVERRFCNKISMPYNYKILYTFISDCNSIYELEIYFKNQHKNFKYNPLLNFKGENECYNKIDEKLISEYILNN